MGGMIEVLILAVSSAALLVSAAGVVLVRRSAVRPLSCWRRWCWRRVATLRTVTLTEGLPPGVPSAETEVGLCIRHEGAFDESEVERQFKDRYGQGA